MTFIKKHKTLLLILLISFILRFLKYKQLFMYSHDQDLSAWFVMDVIKNHDLRLVGQETSAHGVFIGPLYYYLLIPFYLLFNLDPIGGIFLSILIGVLTTLSFYLVLSKVFSKNVGLFASFIHATNFLIFMTEREVVPTTPLFLWTIWFFYALFLLVEKKHSKGLLFSAFLSGLIWHISLSLAVIFILLVPLAILFSKHLPSKKETIQSTLVALLVNLPYLVFEARNSFLQTNALITSITKNEEVSVSFIEKFDRVLQLVSTNSSRFLLFDALSIQNSFAPLLLLGILAFLIYTRKMDKSLGIISILWLFSLILFFSTNAINTSEYYLNAQLTIWIITLALAFNSLKKPLGLLLVVSLAILSFNKLITLSINESGYLQRTALVKEIKQDAQKHNYPCVSVSFITSPGNDLGYRYLFRKENMHVNHPDSLSPVYSIVFPHNMVDKIDRSFGALGLIYPDYKKYSDDEVAESCSGKNSNLTDSLFGFVD